MNAPRYPKVISEVTPSPGAGAGAAPRAGELRTLGTVELLAADDAQRPRALLAQPKRFALLVYLAAAGSRFTRRDTLLPLFWPEHESGAARVALRQAVHFLRRVLGAGVVVGRGAEELALAPEALTFDAALFRQALREGRPADALELYRGDFLAGFFVSGVSPELDHWIETTRASFRDLALRATLALAGRDEATNPGAALHWTRRAAALAPFDESVQRRLIALLDATGDRAGAVHAYEPLHRRLARDLDVQPSAATTALVDAIRARRSPEELRDAAPIHVSAAHGADRLRAMAVLPFRFAGPADEALLGDGIADEVREPLRGVEGLAVVSRIESEGVGSGAEARDALVRLGVEIVVSGEIARIGSRLRVAVRLTTVADGRELWRDSYERDARDLFAITRRLVQAIVGSLRITLADDASQRVVRAPTADLEAYRLYLQGRRHWTKRREALQGLEYLQLAVARDPSFALAHAGIADAYNTLGSWETAELPSWEAFPRAQAAAIKALELDPTLAEGRAALAYAQTHYLWQWERAEQGLREAIALRPSYSHAHHWHSHLLGALGRFDESLAASQRAFELDPLDPVMNVHIAWHHWCAREWNLAVDAAGRSQITFPGEHWPPFFLGLALPHRGETVPAVEALRRALALSRESCVMLGGLGWGLAMAGDRQAAHRIARTLHGVAETRHVASYETAVIHAALDEPDLAFDWLDRAYEERSASLTYLRVDPRLDPLRGDPRFGVLATAVGHPPLIQRGVSSG